MLQSSDQFSGIFICYRRDDSRANAGRLFDWLSEHFGEDQVFIDIDNIEAGEDFEQVIKNALDSCGIFLTVIGKRWLLSADGTASRLNEPDDYVRLEIAAALRRDIRVIPVLVDGATMPRPEDLPSELSRFSKRQAYELSDARWKQDVNRLIVTLETVLAERREAQLRAAREAKEHKAREAEENNQSSGAEAATRVGDTQTGGAIRRARRNQTALIVVGAFIVVTVIVAALYKYKQPQERLVLTEPSNLNATPSPGTNNNQSGTQGGAKPIPPVGMVVVPSGEFLMGNGAGDPYERPVHTVKVESFFIDQFEVTNEKYAGFVKDTQHKPPLTWTNGTYPSGAAQRPVTGVTWDDANDYCAKSAGGRLPTEEEWEFAARGTDGRRYPWGNEWRAGLANADGALKSMVDVGTYKGTSPSGALDMVGNAWEWTASNLQAYPGGRLPEKRLEDKKVVRGGNYQSNEAQATTTYRMGLLRFDDPSRYKTTGFRCVKSLN